MTKKEAWSTMGCPEYEALKADTDSILQEACDLAIKLDMNGLNGLAKANQAIQQIKAQTKVMQRRNNMDQHLKECSFCAAERDLSFPSNSK